MSCCAATMEHVSMTCACAACHTQVLTAQKRFVSLERVVCVCTLIQAGMFGIFLLYYVDIL